MEEARHFTSSEEGPIKYVTFDSGRRELENQNRRFNEDVSMERTREKTFFRKIGVKVLVVAAAVGILAGINARVNKMDAEALAFQQAGKIEDSNILQKNNIGIDDIDFSSDSLEFEIDNIKYELTVGATYDNSGEADHRNHGICSAESIQKNADGKVIKTKIDIRNADGDKEEVSIDEAIMRLGYENK